MGKIYELSFERDFKEEVAAAVKKAPNYLVASNYLGIDDGYAREIANVRGVPLGNLDRCIKAIGMANMEYYYAVVIPYNYAKRFTITEDGLKVFACNQLNYGEAPGNYFRSEVFDVDNNLYRNVLRYWRHHVYNGRTTILEMCEYTGLSDRTIVNARHLNLNPRCSTIQKLLGVYGCRLIIIKSPNKLLVKHIKIKC